jgi:predicted DNA-binding helix-hairpin-helix protein
MEPDLYHQVFLINICSIEELMSLPGIGAKGADKILELREAKGDLELDDLNQVPYLRLTPQLIDCLDFTSFEDKEGLGSLYDRHRERVKKTQKHVAFYFVVYVCMQQFL